LPPFKNEIHHNSLIIKTSTKYCRNTPQIHYVFLRITFRTSTFPAHLLSACQLIARNNLSRFPPSNDRQLNQRAPLGKFRLTDTFVDKLGLKNGAKYNKKVL